LEKNRYVRLEHDSLRRYDSGVTLWIFGGWDNLWKGLPPLPVKNPGPKDLALPLPPGRGLHKVLCLSKVLWNIGVME